jgi:peptidoglycan hydrolase CwlO-like protein
MFADFFSPTTVGVCLIILAYQSFLHSKGSRITDELVMNLKARICTLERSCEDLKSGGNNLQRQITFLQELTDTMPSDLKWLDERIDHLNEEIKKDSDNEIFEWSDDDFQDEDNEEKE